MLKITARIQQIPPDNRGGYELEVGELEGRAPSYREAVDLVELELPHGWRILFVDVDRDGT